MSDRRLTYRVDLPGGQKRLREMILYASIQSSGAERLGRIKLNKILWKSDFDAYAARGVPVTGSAYQRLRLGPAPKAMKPLYSDMLRDRLIREELRDFGNDIIERRPIALVEPDMQFFSKEDLEFVHVSIKYYWDFTGMETSDDSHGIAWLTRADQEPMPYESALLSARSPSPSQMQRLRNRIKEQGLQSE